MDSTVSAILLQATYNFRDSSIAQFTNIIIPSLSVLLAVGITYFSLKHFKGISGLAVSNNINGSLNDRVASDIVQIQKYQSTLDKSTVEGMKVYSYCANDINNLRTLQTADGGLREMLQKKYDSGQWQYQSR